MSIFEHLGVDTYINAAGTYTMIGGACMSERTLNAINEVARSNVLIQDLQEVVHARLAELTRNEAAFISNGAACGLHITAAACIAKKYNRPFSFLSKEQIEETEIIVFRAHRNPYDWALVRLGVRLVEVGFPNMILPSSKKDLSLAINDKTAAIFFFSMPKGGWIAQGGLTLEETLEVAEKYGIPVIVDGAAQLPPVENLWAITGKGADACVFSGGKDLAGPQSSGLIVGKQDLMKWVKETGFPNYGLGRMFKTGREEIVGLFTAVEEYIAMDHEVRLSWCEKQILLLREGLREFPIFSVERIFPNEAGQPIPQALVRFQSAKKDVASIVLKELRNGNPKIFALNIFENGLFINPMSLKEGDVKKIINRFIEISGVV